MSGEIEEAWHEYRASRVGLEILKETGLIRSRELRRREQCTEQGEATWKLGSFVLRGTAR